MGFESRKLGLRIRTPQQDSFVGFLSWEGGHLGAERDRAVSSGVGSETLVESPSLPRGEAKGMLETQPPSMVPLALGEPGRATSMGMLQCRQSQETGAEA